MVIIFVFQSGIYLDMSGEKGGYKNGHWIWNNYENILQFIR